MDNKFNTPPPPYTPGTGYSQPQPTMASAPPPYPHNPSEFYGSQPQATIHQTQTAPGVVRSHTVVTVAPAQPVYVATQAGTQQVLYLGNCPSCRIGFLQDQFDVCGILIAILFFPIGILCCLCMMEKRCSHCGARF